MTKIAVNDFLRTLREINAAREDESINDWCERVNMSPNDLMFILKAIEAGSTKTPKVTEEDERMISLLFSFLIGWEMALQYGRVRD